MKSQDMTEFTDRILIVDDEPYARDALARGMRRLGYEVATARDGEGALRRLDEQEIALVITDLWMPGLDGLELLAHVRQHNSDVAVIVATGADDRETAVVAMREGAYDFIVKPIELGTIRFSVSRALEKRRLQIELAAYQAELEQKVEQRTRELAQKNRELERIILGVIEAIVVTLEARDEYTAHHSHRVADLSVRLARAAGLDPRMLERVRLAALLHDIGKIGIRESVLHKAGRLTDEEFDHIKTHPLVAEQILEPLEQLRAILPSIRHEHEAFDGSGYPDGLAGEAIPLEARIIAVADAYDALTSDRPYREALAHARAVTILEEGAGRIWDPALVARFIEMLESEAAAG